MGLDHGKIWEKCRQYIDEAGRIMEEKDLSTEESLKVAFGVIHTAIEAWIEQNGEAALEKVRDRFLDKKLSKDELQEIRIQSLVMALTEIDMVLLRLDGTLSADSSKMLDTSRIIKMAKKGGRLMTEADLDSFMKEVMGR